MADSVPDGGEAKKVKPERDLTDESLRSERKNSDEALAETRAAVEVEEHTADEILERARVQADAVLDTAREKADAMLAVPAPALVLEREREDEALEAERAAADEELRRERAEQAQTLVKLLPLEREKTDRYLLTERARSDDALANRDGFMGMVSHDLRNLLSGIYLNATQLSEDASDTDEGRRTTVSMKRVQRYVARMNRLIGDLVDVVSIDAGKLALQPARADGALLLTEAADAFNHAASEQSITLEIEPPLTILVANFDYQRLLQVLANLITNALKFTPRGGRIAIRGERLGEELRFTVTDTGSGIASQMLEAIFERFWQVGKNDQRGLGLGLYISRCIVDAHGGKIWAESKLGTGSAFHFTIPALP